MKLPTMRAASAAAAAALVFATSGCSPGEREASPPGTAPSSRSVRPPAVDEYHGVKVVDPYRWLEDSKDPEVAAWSREQTARARAALDAVPSIAKIRERLTDLMVRGSVAYRDLEWAGGRLFALKSRPPLEQPLLVVMTSADDPASEVVLLDPNALDPKGTTSIDFFEPAFDGSLVAVSISTGGSESGDVHVYEVPSGRKLGDVVPRVNGGTAGGSVAWNGDGTGFYYTRYPRAGERPDADLSFYQQVYFHKLGDGTGNDRYETGRDFPRIAEIQLASSRDGRYVLANVQNGDGGEFSQYLRRADGSWTELTRYEDRCVHAALGPDDAVYLVSRLGAPRGKVLRLPAGAAAPSLKDAVTIVPAESDSIETDFAAGSGLWISKDRIFVRYQQGGPTVVKVFDLTGASMGQLPAQPVSSVGSVVATEGGDVLFRQESYLTPPSWHLYRAADRTARTTKLVETSPADFSDSEVVREWAVSMDGTRIPVNILRRIGTKLDGTNPTLLYGYGGFASSQEPVFRARIRLWLEQGGVYAVANIRGGGEFGGEWYRAGNLTRKQNVFDDFAAAARHIVEAGYTRPERLALTGGSNGGLLMGAMIVQHPEMFRATVSFVGLYDMLRVELTPNGAFNVTEYGTVRDPEQFRALYAYSPYHHVEDGTPYPAVLMMTGENDPRVEPWHSRKMTARLQAATSSGRPVLLRTSVSSGHGIGTALSELIGEYTDMYVFLFHELGVEYRPVGSAR